MFIFRSAAPGTDELFSRKYLDFGKCGGSVWLQPCFSPIERMPTILQVLEETATSESRLTIRADSISCCLRTQANAAWERLTWIILLWRGPFNSRSIM